MRARLPQARLSNSQGRLTLFFIFPIVLFMQRLRCSRVKLNVDDTKQEAERITSLLIKTKPLKIFLFGSAALGEMTDQSDFDFLVTFESTEEIRLAQKTLRPYYPLSQYPVDIVWITQQEYDRKKDLGGLCFIVEREGTCLYTKDAIRNDKIKKVQPRVF
jgi:predicted nucleotidyltransferase